VETAGLIKEKVSSYSFDTGRAAVRSSAIVIDMNNMNDILKDDIIMSVSFQMNDGSLFEETTENTNLETGSEPKLPF
jgi:hypothetical protein